MPAIPTEAMTGAFHGVPLSRILGYGAGGLAGAVLENKYIGENLPPELQHVNLGIGGLTGAMLASKNPTMQIAALSSIPLKQMGMFGIGGMDKFRRQQQALTDTNLHTAKIQAATAKINQSDAGGRKLMALAFLLPALAVGAGAGAVGYNAWQHRKKTKPNKFQTDASSGEHRPSQRIRIDIPPSALPKSFYQSLGTATNDPRDYTRMQTKRPVKTASTQATSSFPGLIKDLLWQSSGIPSLHNAWREAGYGMNTLQQGDYENAKRYGLAGAADLGLGVLGLRYGVAPLALRALGRARIGGVIRNQLAAKGTGQWLQSRQLTEMPTVAKWINRWAGGHELGPAHFSANAAPAMGRAVAGKAVGGASGQPMSYISGADRMVRRKEMGLSTRSPQRRALDMSGRYDPQRYDFVNPTNKLPILGSVLRTGQPKSLPGHAINAVRYGLNRGVNAAYAAKQYVKRHPLLGGSMTLPLVAAGGVVQDDAQRQHALQQERPWFPDFSGNSPSGDYMPVSSMATNLLGAFGGGGAADPLRRQFVH